MAQEVVRIFNQKDDDVVVHSSLVLEYFKEHELRFRDLSSTKYSPEFTEYFTDTLDSAESTLSDMFIRAAQVRETSELGVIKDDLVKTLNKLEFYVDEAFESDPLTANEFYLANVRDYSHHVQTFIGYTQDLLVTVISYKEKLMAVDMKPDMIANISNLLEALKKQHHEQRSAIHRRARATQDRILKMNKLWEVLVKIKEGAKYVFENEPELRKLFDLPKSRLASDDIIEDEVVEDVEDIEKIEKSEKSNDTEEE